MSKDRPYLIIKCNKKVKNKIEKHWIGQKKAELPLNKRNSVSL